MRDDQKEKERRQTDYLTGQCGFSPLDIIRLRSHPDKWTPERIISECKRLEELTDENGKPLGFHGEEYYREHFFEAHPELSEEHSPAQEERIVQVPRHAKKASEFGEDNTTFLWYPYLPRKEYTVLMADGGTGKSFFCCGLAAAITSGRKLPGDDEVRSPGSVLFISAEDYGEKFKSRLACAGADLDKCFIIDRRASGGMNFDSGYSEFHDTILHYKPSLVILDPWHNFVGDSVDISRVNAIRPLLQRLATIAGDCDCSIIAISHVNKRAQGENANHAATGSTDFINAARSALRIVFDEVDEDRRIMIHTKSNYAPHGISVAYSLKGGQFEWDGFSEITKQTLEAAARSRKTPGEFLQDTHASQASSANLMQALMDFAQNTETCGKRTTCEAFKMQYGEDIFGFQQPKRALDSIVPEMLSRGYDLKTGLSIKTGSSSSRGFYIRKLPLDAAIE